LAVGLARLCQARRGRRLVHRPQILLVARLPLALGLVRARRLLLVSGWRWPSSWARACPTKGRKPLPAA